MIPSAGPPIPRWAWAFAVCALLAWNTFLAQYAGPMSMTQPYDGAQYQLLARNRLAGHYETGDQAHTVRTEGRHPMWQPGLVWLTELVARVLGSVQHAAWLLSALGTTLMEVSLLWLSWRCFGRGAWTVLLAGLFLPFHWNAVFVGLAVGQGPEPWAAAFVLLGWALFLKSLGDRSALLALLSGIVFGGAEWFRTGNLLLFAAPWAVFTGFALVRRARSEVRYCVTTLVGFVGMNLLAGWLTASPVNKMVANLWANLIEHHGLQLVEDHESGPQVHYLAALALAPGTQETYYDYIVRVSGSSAGAQFWQQHRAEVFAMYLQRLGEVAASGGSGLRRLAGEWVLVFALLQIVLALVRRDTRTLITLAFLAGFLGHYLGPVTLLRGDKPTHYLFVALPILVLLGSGGAAASIDLVRNFLARNASAGSPSRMLVVAACLSVAPLVVLGASFYNGAVETMREECETARRDFADLDTLNLEGKRIAARSMAWFVDRNVETFLSPYACVPELEQYVLHHGLDGFLFRAQEKHRFFNAMPYEALDEFETALGQSRVFGCPRTAGVWRWYPVAPLFRSNK